MARYPIDDFLLKDNINSCVEYEENSTKIIFPYRFRDQNRIHPASCMQHAICLVVECLYRKNAKLSGDKDEKLMVDIGMLIRKLPPPVDIETLFDYFKNNEIKAELGNTFFRIKRYETFLLKKPEDSKKVLKYFRDVGGAGLGLFSYTKDCKPVPGEIFVRGVKRTGKTKCPGCKSPLRMVHAVCVTGIAWMKVVNSIPRQVFQYVDSERPSLLNYMTIESMDTIVLAYLN